MYLNILKIKLKYFKQKNKIVLMRLRRNVYTLIVDLKNPIWMNIQYTYFIYLVKFCVFFFKFFLTTSTTFRQEKRFL